MARMMADSMKLKDSGLMKPCRVAKKLPAKAGLNHFTDGVATQQPALRAYARSARRRGCRGEGRRGARAASRPSP